MHSENLKRDLLQLLDGSLGESDITKFVHFCRALCQAHLVHVRSSVFLLASQHGLTITDLAYDCIAETFARNEHGCFHHLEDFVGSLRDEIQKLSETEVLFAFRAFLTRVVDAQLARLYAQSDSEGAKIHRCIRVAAGRSDKFALVKDLRGCVLQLKDGDAFSHLPGFPLDELEQMFLADARTRHSIPQLLSYLYDALVNQSSYRRSIPVTDVVRLVKKVHMESIDDSSDTGQSSSGGLSETEIEELRRHVEASLKEKILLTYFARGKLNRAEAEAVFNAFRNALADWSATEEQPKSLYQYLRSHLAIDERTYEREFRVKLEYLLKFAREQFAARLMTEL